MTDDELLQELGMGSSPREDMHTEFKESAKGLPRSFWETYSAFANTDGGTVILGNG